MVQESEAAEVTHRRVAPRMGCSGYDKILRQGRVFYTLFVLPADSRSQVGTRLGYRLKVSVLERCRREFPLNIR